MKKSTKILLLTAAALSALALLVACGGGEKPVESSVPPESDSTADLNEIRSMALSFADAVKNGDVVKMETLGGVPVDTYGDWNKPKISAVDLAELSISAERAVFKLTVSVSDNGGAETIDVGDNRYTLTVAYDSDSGAYEFDFVKDE